MRCDVENPAFDSQTKDCMNTPIAKFGSTCTISDGFIEKLAKMGVMTAACAITELKENKLIKKMDGTKTKSIRGIPKLIDANWAGTDRSMECIIIFCEGDSAKAGIVSGLISEDRNNIGVYPLKGKVMNVRGELNKKISENKEIAEIKKILGLENNKVYTPENIQKCLRYGKVMFMTDQDLDGSHIKGLCINLFQSEWPSLTEIPGFIGFMNTPILKARKNNTELMFYNEGEYNEWKVTNQQGWKVKYYKGLGTSTAKEFREYFKQKKMVGFNHTELSDNSIDMVFNKKRADDRKDWLKNYDRESYLNTGTEMVSYEDFINKELIHFSKYDCDRSIPNLMDGLKISLRKILFSAFKKNLVSEIKVAQFSGYISEQSCYHHGEASLNQAIVGMAQNFVGSNNINVLVPSGQFGTRLQGGKDSASERYIHTALSKITRYIYNGEDDNILQYLNDDGYPVEPRFYAPIIPMILVNGSKGIGTGFSTDIMCYNPLDIIAYLREKLHNTSVSNHEEEREFTPYYEGFRGPITKVSAGKYLFKGMYEKVKPDTIRVTELPIGYWTQDFKEHLEVLAEGAVDKDGKKVLPVIKDYDDMSKDTNVDFTIVFQKGKLDELQQVENGIEKLLKLNTTNSTTNMHLFDEHDKLQKYENVAEIIDAYYVTRLRLYDERKQFMIAKLENELLVMVNKSNYIQELLDDTIDLRKKKTAQIVEMLQSKGYATINDDAEYKYLIKLPMDSVTEENVDKIMQDKLKKEDELVKVQGKTISAMWLDELDSLEEQYVLYKLERGRLMGELKIKKEIKKVKKVNKLIIED